MVKEPYVYELPEYLSYQTGALIEPLSVATHAVRRRISVWGKPF